MKIQRIVLIVLLLMSIMLEIGISGVEKSTVQLQEEYKQLKETYPKGIERLEKDPRIEISTKLSEFSMDIDENGVEEKIVLYTSAERDSEGNMLWDDGQQWLLVVEDLEEGNYVLFQDYIQIGNLYFDVFINNNGEKVISTTLALGPYKTITNYTYNKDKDIFIEEVVYDSGIINNLYTSVPSY